MRRRAERARPTIIMPEKLLLAAAAQFLLSLLKNNNNNKNSISDLISQLGVLHGEEQHPLLTVIRTINELPARHLLEKSSIGPAGGAGAILP